MVRNPFTICTYASKHYLIGVPLTTSSVMITTTLQWANILLTDRLGLEPILSFSVNLTVALMGTSCVNTPLANSSPVYNLRIPFNLFIQMSNPKSNLPDENQLAELGIWIIVKLQNWCVRKCCSIWYFSKISTYPSSPVFCKSNLSRAIFTRHGQGLR